jgi:hypothetical protein
MNPVANTFGIALNSGDSGKRKGTVLFSGISKLNSKVRPGCKVSLIIIIILYG